jgi:hypothetical protein
MSPDEHATEVGRMALERKQLEAHGVTLSEKIRRFAIGLSALSHRLEGAGSAYLVEPVLCLTADEIRLLQSYPEINDLLTEAAEGSHRYHELKQKLAPFGF